MIKKILAIRIGRFKISTLVMMGLIFFVLVSAFQHMNQVKKNKQLIEEKLTSQLSYNKSNRPTDLAYITRLEGSPSLNYEQKGILAERRAYISDISSQMIDYYKNMGKALFYFGETKDYNRLLYIYTDLADHYLDNSDLKSAYSHLEQAQIALESADASEIYAEYLSYYYRVRGLYAREIGEYTSAHDYFARALEQGGKIDLPVYHTDYKRRTEVLGYYSQMAGIQDILTYIYQGGDIKKYEKLLEDYRYMELSSQSQYYELLASEYNLPLLESHIRIAVAGRDFEKAKDYIRQYSALCSIHNLSHLRIKMWIYYQNVYMQQADDDLDPFYVEIGDAYSAVASDMNLDYMEVMSDEVNDAMTSVAEMEAIRKARTQRAIVYLVVVSAILFTSYIIYNALNRNKIDALTGVQNRRALDAYLQALDRKHDDISGIMIDIDNFKSVNDTYGHDVGDAVLKQLGSILVTRDDGDTRVYRYGGEEFSVLTSFQQHLSVVELAESIRRDVADSTWPQGIKVTISLGVATHLAPDKVLPEADQRLYYAKHNGKNVVCYMRNGIDTLYKY